MNSIANMPFMANTIEDFWNRVNKRGPKSAIGSRCWVWEGGSQKYGVFNFQNQKFSAHRFAYMLKYGSVPEGMDVHHKCHFPLCVRPSHLEALLPAVHSGLHDHGVYNVVKTHCPYGHEYSEENTFVRSHGGRECRSCMRDRDRKRVASGKIRSNPTKKVCKRMHLLSGENLGHIPSSGGWYCKSCHRETQRERRGGSK